MSLPNNQRVGPSRAVFVAAVVSAAVILSCALPWQPSSGQTNGGRVGGGLPLRRPPQGMLELPTGGAGRVLTSRMSGTPSARKMLTALFIGIEGYFDARPTLTAAFADAADQNLQAAFVARLGGVPVRGVMAIQMRGGAGQATLVFDRWETFPQTFAQLAEAVSRPAQGGGRSPEPVRLTPTTLPDGSGRIGLPPGWRIVNSYKGTVDLQGPRGEIMGLGATVAVNSKMMGGMYAHIPKVDFNDPVRAALDYAAFQRQQVRVIDAKPVQLPVTGRWAFMRFQMVINDIPVDGLGLYGIMPVDQVQGILYISYAIAPSQVFRASLPAMWAAWQSWGVSNAVLSERLNGALASMRETGDIIAGSYGERQETYARVNRAWSDVMRDESVWRDPSDPNTHYRVRGNPSPAQMGGLEPVPLRDLIP
ncbi:MAG: hypothetical protein JOZ96_17545 [Acidobacteria bacterium]|nr:hypothetical protein [Acidobacteriota bacterium]